jgi:hypothetical protein
LLEFSNLVIKLLSTLVSIICALLSEGPKTATRGGEWEAKISFENNWLLSQNHHQMHEQNTVISTTQLVGGCSLGTQWDTTNKHETRTKPRGEKKILNSYREEASSQPKVPMPTGNKST